MQSNLSESPDAKEEQAESDSGVPLSESLLESNQSYNSDTENTGELNDSSSEPPLEAITIDSIEKSVCPEIVTGSLLEVELSLSELSSDSLSELSVSEENNQAIVTVINSEPSSDLQDSSLKPEENQNSLAPIELTGAALARRLNVSPSTLRHKKNARNFGQWTSGHDPDGIAWYFDGQKFTSKTFADTQ